MPLAGVDGLLGGSTSIAANTAPALSNAFCLSGSVTHGTIGICTALLFGMCVSVHRTARRWTGLVRAYRLCSGLPEDGRAWSGLMDRVLACQRKCWCATDMVVLGGMGKGTRTNHQEVEHILGEEDSIDFL